MMLALVSAIAGLWSLYASFEVYRLRRAWTGYVSAGLSFMSLAVLLVGPAISIASILLLRKANAEDEFEDAPTPA